MKNVKKGKDNFVEFDNFDEVKEVFEEAMKIMEDKDGERFKKLLFEEYYKLHPEEKQKSSK